MLTINGKETEIFTDLIVTGNTAVSGTLDVEGNTTINANLKTADGTTGGISILAAEATASITAVATVTIQVNVPTASKLIGCQLRVDTALAVGETWDAVYVTGATQSIATNQAVAQNTKVNKFFDANAATDIASAEVDITIERNSNPGVDTFTAQGVIRAIVYYEAFTAMANA